MEKTLLDKNFECEVQIENFGVNGEGVAHINGVPVFVPFAIPGEVAKIRIINTKGKIAIGKILELKKTSGIRVEPRCPYFEKCGGCDIQHINYDDTLKFKQELVAKNLKNIAKVDCPVAETVASREYYYRNKCSLPVAEVDGRTVIGMFRELEVFLNYFLLIISPCHFM